MTDKLLKKGNFLHYYPNIDDPGYLTFSLGNRKLSSRVLIFSLPAGADGTCPCTCPGCYARKTERIFPSAAASRGMNLSMLQAYGPRVIVSAIKAILNKYRHLIDAIRIHEGGDFYSAAYANAWMDAAAHAREFRIATYTYTKTSFPPLPGINVVQSTLPNGELNYGPADDLDAKRYRSGLSADDPTCPATLGQDVICGKDCTYCHHMQYVLFVQH